MPLHEWHLPTGAMRLTTSGASRHRVADLLDVGSRQNPKRPFVFVSKVLGKHIPCSPARMRQAQETLAAELGPEPALVIGMAETATGLGEGVFTAWQALTGAPGLYIATTRYPMRGCEAVSFTESHSHATILKLYRPDSEAMCRRLTAVRRVILVDDEVSTGKTFASLVDALKKLAPGLTTIEMVALTDFSGGSAIERLRAVPGIELVRVHTLLSGVFEFEAGGRDIAASSLAQRDVGCRRNRMMAATPRCGITHPLQLTDVVLQAAAGLVSDKSVRLIATGECIYPAQRLGEWLEDSGLAVAVQSTTRSPLMVGGAIESSLVVTDPYGEGIDNYIYNLPDPIDDEVCIIVHETGDTPQIRWLCAELGSVALDIDTGYVMHPVAKRAVA